MGKGFLNPSGFFSDKIFGRGSTMANILDPSGWAGKQAGGSLGDIIDPARVEANREDKAKKVAAARIADRDERLAKRAGTSLLG
tara:strand:- start:2523 stop:2774 length:252 start_codon:yes stop_codon:yes gene_type:complete